MTDTVTMHLRTTMNRLPEKVGSCSIGILSMLAMLVMAGIPGAGALHAQAPHQVVQGSHTVNVSVAPILVMTVSGNPMTFLVDRNVQDGRVSLTVPASFYNLTSNLDNVVLEAAVDMPFPEGVQLDMRVTSRLGRSHGWIPVSAALSGMSAVSGLNRGLENGQSISYRLTVDPNVRDIPLQYRRVSLTVLQPKSNNSFTVSQEISFGVLSKASTKTE